MIQDRQGLLGLQGQLDLEEQLVQLVKMEIKDNQDLQDHWVLPVCIRTCLNIRICIFIFRWLLAVIIHILEMQSFGL